MSDVFVGEYSLSGIAVSGVTPASVEDDGGTALTITGVFQDATAQVFLVDSLDREFRCYSGAAGQGYTPRPANPVTLFCATPPVPPGTYAIKVVQGADSVRSDVGGGAFTLDVQTRQWKSRTYSLRRVFPPWYALGPRSLDNVELLP